MSIETVQRMFTESRRYSLVRHYLFNKRRKAKRRLLIPTLPLAVLGVAVVIWQTFQVTPDLPLLWGGAAAIIPGAVLLSEELL